MSRPAGTPSRWQPSATARRRASVGVGLVLLVVCGAAIGETQRVGAHVTTVSETVKLAGLFQDARFYGSAADTELLSYELTEAGATWLAHQQEAQALDATLQTIAAIDPADGPKLTQMLTASARFQLLGRRVVQLLVNEDPAGAVQVQREQIDPLIYQFGNELAALESAHAQVSAHALSGVRHNVGVLRFGTPIALALALLSLAGLASVTRAHRRTLQRQAHHDALTGLPNRPLFLDRAAQALATATRGGVEPVVMMLDLDRFKEVNDTLGHRQGDELLIQVGARLAASIRPSDTVARLGGDEFAILLPGGGRRAATDVAVRILSGLERPFDLDGVAVSIEASIGIALMATGEPADEGRDADPATDLLQRADTAMYQAKAQRSGYLHYSSGAQSGQPGRLALLGELRQALELDQLVLHYQPKVSADTGDLQGVEALARWNHPTRGLLPPSEFIEIAESTSLIERLTTVVIDKALAFSKSWLLEDRPLPVAVNVSARSLLNSQFPATVAAQLKAAGVPPDLLCIELTESTIMSDPAKALTILNELQSMGVRLSVDDFGTGYSSMAYLKILPVDELKIDRTFVAHMTTDNHDSVLVGSAIDLGHNLGLSVVAEGVEDEDTLMALRALGADILQGYFIARPMPGDQLKRWDLERSGVTPARTARA